MKVVWTPKAQNSMATIHDYIAENNPVGRIMSGNEMRKKLVAKFKK